jgi:hypothetical protein
MDTRSADPDRACELCARAGVALTEHHLIPRAVHRKRQFRQRFDLDEMRHRKLLVCRKCHRGIHRLIPDEKELARTYNTRDALLADERIARHVAWVAKQRT